LKDVLRRLLAGELTEDEALGELRSLQLEELGGRARLDLGRFMRRGIPEVVLATGKAPAEAARLTVALAERQGQGLISRMTPEHRSALGQAAGAAQMSVIDHANSARIVRQGFVPEPLDGKVALLTAGTSDVALPACIVSSLRWSRSWNGAPTFSWWPPAWMAFCQVWWRGSSTSR
jgi:NCAIR mutase (PurE)-related protein